MRCDIKLRSPETEQAYQQSDKSPLGFLHQKLQQYPDHKTIIKLNNNYPYNLKPEYKHQIAWAKGYTWKEIENLVNDKRAPFTSNAAFYWINHPKFRSITTIPHYHIIHEKH